MTPVESATQRDPRRWRGRPRTAAGVVLLIAVAIALIAGIPIGCFRQLAVRIFGPPPVTMREAYAPKPGGPTFDHSVLDDLANEHVTDGGWVDYEGLGRDESRLDHYIQSLADAPFDSMGRDEKLALLINAYNAFTLRLILDHYPVSSIRDIPAGKRWKDNRWNIGGHVWSLDQIEHEQIRPKFIEPRIHFAVNCAAIGCAPLRGEAYVADRINDQLEDQSVYVHDHDRWFQLDPTGKAVRLTELYSWYRNDFEQVSGSVLDFAAGYSPALRSQLDQGDRPVVNWIDYDWKLNDVKNR